MRSTEAMFRESSSSPTLFTSWPPMLIPIVPSTRYCQLARQPGVGLEPTTLRGKPNPSGVAVFTSTICVTCLDAETYTRMVRNLFWIRICAIGCLVAFLSSFASGQVAEDNFIVAVLQANGIMIPVASYDGTLWTNSWPGPVRRPTTPPAPLE